MSTVGSELPPHLSAKRKRRVDEEGDQAASDRRTSRSRSSSSDGAQKRPRVIGPSLPPAVLAEIPTSKPNADAESDSDDDFGPAPPPTAGQYDASAEAFRNEAAAAEEQAREAVKKPQREEWMLVPPKQDDWSSRVDPTKLKNRKFNTGKGAKGPAQNGGTDSTIWTETPEEKRKRLEDEVMGVKEPAHLGRGSHNSASSSAEAKETEKRIRDYNVSDYRPYNVFCSVTFCLGHLLRDCFRNDIEIRLCTKSTRKLHRRRRRMIQASEHSTRRRTSGVG
jgi:hypothetical protein